MICEMCGAETPRARIVQVERTTLRVCDKCVKFGTELAGSAGGIAPRTTQGEALDRRSRRQTQRDIYTEEVTDVDLADDFHKRIFQARNAKGWSQDDLGRKINEKKSIISQLETKQIRPDDRLIRKLETALGIKLKEEVSKVAAKKESSFKKDVTLGDLMKAK